MGLEGCRAEGVVYVRPVDRLMPARKADTG
jgi:hypothetical protein